MFEEDDQPEIVTITSSDASVSFDIPNPYYGDLTETVTLFEYYSWAIGA